MLKRNNTKKYKKILREVNLLMIRCGVDIYLKVCEQISF